MDVRIKLSLAGGHHWEFVCDEDDPLVAGIVSALPGATADASLPPDGLIQVESRSGERLFLTRSSLVAVSISHVPIAFGPVDDAHISRRVRPTDYVHVQGMLSAPAIADILQLQEVAGLPTHAPSAMHEIKLPTLSDAVVDALISAAAYAARDFGVEPAAPSHLDVRLFHVPTGVAAGIPSSPSDAILHLLVGLSEESRLAVQLADRVIGTATSGERGAGRDIALSVGDGLAVAAAVAPPIETTVSIQPGLILVASLCLGDRRATE
jgi:hypothetical protein